MPRRTAERLAGLAVLAIAAALFALAFAHNPTAPTRETITRTAADCGVRLIRDWRDGRIDGTYPIVCYRRAAKDLPTDLRVYSSAPDDIRQALAERVAQGGTRRAAG